MDERENDIRVRIWISITVAALVATAVAVGSILLFVRNNPESPAAEPTFDTVQNPVHIAVERLPTFTLTPTYTLLPSPTVPAEPTAPDSPETNQIPSPSPDDPSPTGAQSGETATAVSTAPGCRPPEGWEPYSVMEGDTLFAFELGAKRADLSLTVDDILEANCLGTTVLQIGQVLWLPAEAIQNAPPPLPPQGQAPPAITSGSDPSVAGGSRTGQCPCTITVRAGWRIEQIADAIDAVPVAFTGAEFLAVAGKGAPLPPRDFLASVPAGNGLEGFMFPGTYTLQNDTSATGFRDMLLDAFAANAAGITNTATSQGVTPYEAVILASIIQKESGSASEQQLVASVFYNRMRAGKGLGATVTIMYALGRPGNWWPRLQPGQANLNSPYNTLTNLGFPPTPINSPGITALQAAASPAQTNYLYFTGNCRGPGNAYAVTYEAHLANVA
ncbi:MAG: endolytic transglycosylase MltG [Chloroflexi bacterium]|nr:endolytic transglycosylase MltG [Chloroflexota bacterium]